MGCTDAFTTMTECPCEAMNSHDDRSHAGAKIAVSVRYATRAPPLRYPSYTYMYISIENGAWRKIQFLGNNLSCRVLFMGVETNLDCLHNSKVYNNIIVLHCCVYF